MFVKKAILTGFVLAAVSLAQSPAPRGRAIITHAVSKRGYLGVGVVELTGERAKALKLADSSGVEVKRVDENSPASRAGLKENDIILEVNGKKIDEVEEFIRMIGDTDPGSKVTLSVWRDGAKHNLSATLQARSLQSFVLPGGDLPPMPAMPDMPNGPWGPLFTGQSPRVGFEGETLSAQLAEYFGVKEGVLVRSVSAKTPAEKAGLKAGDVITKVSGTPVTTPREISGLVRASHKTFTFTVMRNHKEILLNVEIAGARMLSPDQEIL